MRSFLLMLGFFTRIPVPMVEYTEERYAKGMYLMPFVGLVSGGLLFGLSFIHRFLPMPVTALLLFILYLLITGGLHLDGLGDSCDALFSARDRDRMLEIMKDSRSGSFGVLGLIAASAAYLIGFTYTKQYAVLLFPVVGKCMPIIASMVSEYIRPHGMAEVFARHASKGVLAFTLALGAGLCAAFGPIYLIAFGVAIGVSTGLALRIRRILGGYTGDILGLLCEVSQLVFLLVCTLDI